MKFEYIPESLPAYTRDQMEKLAAIAEDKEAPVWVRSKASMLLHEVENALFTYERVGLLIATSEDEDPIPPFSTN